MSDSLQARKLSLTLLHDILRGGQDIDMALDKNLSASLLDKRDKAFVTLLVMTTMRHLRVVDALLAQYLQSSLEAKNAAYVQDALRLGAVQLLWLDVPPHAAVHSTVELVKQSKFKGFAKLANGVLQSITRSGQEKCASLDAPRLATPDWLWQRWTRDWGQDTARKIAVANLQEPALDITVKANPAHWAEKLGGQLLPNGSIRLQDAGIIPLLEGFSEGEWWVQDFAASLPVRLFDSLKGKKALDLCAAPGGKTAQLAAAGAQVRAVDKSPARLRRVGENLKRLGLNAAIEAADILQWQPKTVYDAILLDAPCSATGTIRRHPDIVFRKQERDIQELAQLQRQMLLRTLDWLAPGGELVYCTCSLEKDEGEAHIEAIVSTGKVVQVPVTIEGFDTPGGYMRTMPFDMAKYGGMDGFFAAKFKKI